MSRLAERLVDRVTALVDADLDLTAYAMGVMAAFEREVPGSLSCLGLTEPTSGLIVRAMKSREIPCGDQEFVRLELAGEDINRFADLARRSVPVASLWTDTGGRPETCRRYAEFLHPALGFTDELRVAFVGGGLTWGVLGMYRQDQDHPYTEVECEAVAAAAPEVVRGLRRGLVRRSGEWIAGAAEGPAVVLVDVDGNVEASAAGWQAVDWLGGLDHGSLPTGLLSAVEALRVGYPSAMVRLRASSGRWLTVRAAPLDVSANGSGRIGPTVVLSITATNPGEFTALALDAYALTRREQEVANLVLQGCSTSAIAGRLHLSAFTVQDHLKAVFRNTGVSSRRDLVALLISSTADR